MPARSTAGRGLVRPVTEILSDLRIDLAQGVGRRAPRHDVTLPGAADALEEGVEGEEHADEGAD
jgi:hypothetical protein